MASDSLITLGGRLRGFRMAAGLTQEALAEGRSLPLEEAMRLASDTRLHGN